MNTYMQLKITYTLYTKTRKEIWSHLVRTRDHHHPELTYQQWLFFKHHLQTHLGWSPSCSICDWRYRAESQTVWEPYKEYLSLWSSGLWVRESCPGPCWGRQPWNDFSGLVSCLCSVSSYPWANWRCKGTWGSYLCKGPCCCWEKRKRGKGAPHLH